MTDASEDEAADEPAPQPKKSAASGPPLVLRVVLGAAGLLLVVGFFLPWLKLGDLASVSGMELVFSDSVAVRTAVGETQRWILLAIPALGLALTALGFLGVRFAGPIAAIVGIVLIGYGVVTVVTAFVRATGVGLWLVIGGAFLAFGAGLFAWIRARVAAQAARGERLPPDGTDAD